MSALKQFEKDEQFVRLVRRERDVDLVVAALEIARDEQPNLDFQPSLQKLRGAVSQLTRPVAMATSELNELRLVIHYMTEELCLHGHYECFDQAEASYLNRVLETGRGIPLTLSLIYMAVAREFGIPLVGIGAPSHFLTCLQTDQQRWYVDAFRGGHLMQEDECVAFLQTLTKLPAATIRQSLKKPATDRQIVTRMLYNLKAFFGGTLQWRSAWRVQRRLALLSPGSYRERRDLAILSLRAGRPGESLTLLDKCLAVCPDEDRDMLNGYRQQAIAQIPRLN